MPLHSPNFVAGGPIYPSSIVVQDPTADATDVGSFVVLQAAPADVQAVNLPGAGGSNAARSLVGIAMPGTDYPPLNDPHVSIGDAYGNPYAAIGLSSMTGVQGATPESLEVAGIGDYAFLRLQSAVLNGQFVTVCQTSAATGAASSSYPLPGWGAPVGAYSSAAPQQYVGKALQSGAAGELILVLVNPGIF